MRIAILARPNDAPGYDLRIAEELRGLIPDVAVLTDRITNADVILVVIGPAWTSHPDADSVERLERVLTSGSRVVPVLVQGGRIPAGHLLPQAIRPLVFHAAAELRHATFAEDLQRALKQVQGGQSGPWTSDAESGTLEIISNDRGTLLRAFGKWDSGGPVNVVIDGAVVGAMHLFGDKLSLPLPPGTHEVLLRAQFEKPVSVTISAGRTVQLHVERNVMTGWVKVKQRS